MQMLDVDIDHPVGTDTEELPTRRLVGEISSKAYLLVRKELDLAKAELEADLRAQIAMAKGLAIGIVAGICGLSMLLVAAVLGLALVMPGWLAALLVGGVVLAIAAGAGLYGWSQRVRSPLAVTRRTLKEDLQWAKEQLS
jgi:hypothetical protein